MVGRLTSRARIRRKYLPLALRSDEKHATPKVVPEQGVHENAPDMQEEIDGDDLLSDLVDLLDVVQSPGRAAVGRQV